MTLPSAPHQDPGSGYSVDPSPLPPPAVSSPMASIVAEKRRTSALSLLLGVALVVAVGGVAFAAGRLTAPATTAAAGNGFGRGGNGTGFGGGNGFTPGASGAPGAGFAGGLGTAAEVTVTGTVQSISATSITLSLPTGATVDIPIDASTTYHGQTAAAAGDVKSGDQVVVEMAGFGGRGGFAGGTGTGQRSPNASAPAPGASDAGRGPGVRGEAGPARDITIVTP